MRAQAAAGHPAFTRHLADGHDVACLRDVDYLVHNENRSTALLG
jgi:hypothetical protein